jgi:hypothetical protein
MKFFAIGALFLFWMAISVRALERGDLPMAGVYALVGIALTGYRISTVLKPRADQGF